MKPGKGGEFWLGASILTDDNQTHKTREEAKKPTKIGKACVEALGTKHVIGGGRGHRLKPEGTINPAGI